VGEEEDGGESAPVVYPDLLHTMHSLSVWHTYEVGSLPPNIQYSPVEDMAFELLHLTLHCCTC